MYIGTRIALLRKQAGMTQAQLAELLCTTRQAVSKWESGKSTPDVDCVIRICSHFQVTTDYLLLGKKDELKPVEVSMVFDQKTDKHKFRKCRKRFAWVLLACTVILVLMPFFASVYQVYMRNLGPYYSNPNDYLWEYPLCLIMWTTILGVICGILGVIWYSFAIEHT